MKEKEISIKSSLETIQIPTEKLDRILYDAFVDKPAPKRSRKKWLYTSAAAAMLAIGILTTSMIASPALANLAVQIPVIGNVFSFFVEDDEDNEPYESYEYFSEAVGLTQIDSGIEIIIDQAIYDGTNVTLSFLLKTDEPLEEGFHFASYPQVEGANPGNAGMEFEYVENVGYAGIIRVTPDLNEELGGLNITWEPGSVMTHTKEIEGNWKFNFAVTQILKEPMPLAIKVKEEGVTVHLKEVTFTDISVNIAYQQLVDPAYLTEWSAVEAELIAQDNLGEVYNVPYNGGSTDGSAKTAEDFNWTATMSGLDPRATSLTFYPFATVSNFDEETQTSESKRLEFDAVQIDLTDHSHTIIKDPTIPELPKDEELIDSSN
ncbi:DUF4179 domain-containing protein [Planococcus halotolerans]|uniref:DUF4179 domain-containing protein n=1 Tax=Planococcus halotolerans TaxID=2233542 RepID=UPI0010927A68|nr:DUF4179 domain-containing protein [Planococcus halotolerans]QHJ69978.1 DUF4179 domain-containing protein [Planococcus halotolerans]